MGRDRLAAEPVAAAFVAQQIAPAAAAGFATIRRTRQSDRARAGEHCYALSASESAPERDERVVRDAYVGAGKPAAELEEQALAAAGDAQPGRARVDHTRLRTVNQWRDRGEGRVQRAAQQASAGRPAQVTRRAALASREQLSVADHQDSPSPAPAEIDAQVHSPIGPAENTHRPQRVPPAGPTVAVFKHEVD